MAATRELKIKTGVVKRTHKELGLYKKESEREAGKLETMKGQGADEHDVRHQENVLHESKMMIPETEQRLKTGVAELDACLGDFDAADEQEDVKVAREVLAAAKETLAAE
ncbi:unnamed protein product [Pedinophyceae sp. YPF-701]|nr:unnamed protein product [Pedinophyceae sp. YPF-701]